MHGYKGAHLKFHKKKRDDSIELTDWKSKVHRDGLLSTEAYYTIHKHIMQKEFKVWHWTVILYKNKKKINKVKIIITLLKTGGMPIAPNHAELQSCINRDIQHYIEKAGMHRQREIGNTQKAV